MPNWCRNTLYVKGDLEKVKDFVEYAKGEEEEDEETEPLDEEQFIPVPDNVERHEDPELMSREMYKWKCSNWGTKWGFCRPTSGSISLIGSDEGSIRYSFDTAWSPPEPLIKAMGKEFPTLTFELRYAETGMDFMGILRIEENEVVRDESDNIMPENVPEDLPKHQDAAEFSSIRVQRFLVREEDI